MIEYLYTGVVEGVTCGVLDCDKLQSILQTAQYFDIDTLTTAATKWAQQCGVSIESDNDNMSECL
jgi:hypothetical protein